MISLLAGRERTKDRVRRAAMAKAKNFMVITNSEE